MHPDKFLGRVEETPAAPAMDKREILKNLGQTLAAKKRDAINARETMGLDTLWSGLEDAYNGIDDANRGEFSGSTWAKPNSINGPLTKERPANTGASTIFVRMTSRYVDFAVGKMCEIGLPIDEKPFGFKPSPVPELIEKLKDEKPLNPATLPPELETEKPMQPVSAADLAKRELTKANDCAEKAATRIYDWLVDSAYATEVRKVIHDAGRLGTGVLKGPYPETISSRAITTDEAGKTVLTMQKAIRPSVKWVDLWNFYPAEGCGENIQDGAYVFERDYISEQSLRDMKEVLSGLDHQGVMKDQIDRVIAMGPKKELEREDKDEMKKTAPYEVWYYTGDITREDLAASDAIGCENESGESVRACVTMVNDMVVNVVIDISANKRFPYHVMTWSRRRKCWAGVGVAELLTQPQRMINAGTRRLNDNLGMASGAQIVMDELGIIPADGSRNMAPVKFWLKTSDSTMQAVKDAFAVFTIPSMQADLAAYIEYAMRLAEEVTQIPLVTQGFNGSTTPQTFGQAELQNNNAMTWLRSIGYRYDNMIVEPLINDYYDWLLLDESVPDDEKGDFQVDVLGSSVLIERAIQEMSFMQLGQLTLNPAYGLNPKLWAETVLKQRRIDPETVQYTEEELKQMQSQPPPVAPAIEAAKINAQAKLQDRQIASQTAIQVAAGHDQATVAKTQADTDRDRVYVEAETQRTRAEYEIRMQELAQKERLLTLEYAQKHQLTLEQVKASLTETSMKLNVQRELSDLRQKLTPPSEPAGRAEPGRAYEQ